MYPEQSYDYERLYMLIMRGYRVAAWVDSRGYGRQIAELGVRDEPKWGIGIGCLGVDYGGTYNMTDSDKFFKLCRDMQIGWLDCYPTDESELFKMSWADQYNSTTQTNPQ